MMKRTVASASRMVTQQIRHHYRRYHQLQVFLHSSRSPSNRPLKQATRCICHDGGDGRQGNYFDRPFWDSTYASESQPLEWYQSYSELSPLLKQYIPSCSRILMSGCGNSEFSEDMVKDGFKEIVNIDISSVVIEAMKKKYQNVPELKYLTMDVLDMSSFEEGSFDCVIDKGTLDAIMCIAGGPYNIAMMLAEIARVLKAGGVYMLISFAGPELSLPLLNRDVFGWSIDTHVLYKQGSKEGCPEAYSEPILLNVKGAHDKHQRMRLTDSLYIYMCTKHPDCV
ncbi:hypothetical protein L7F22_065970 [Adiantum nelumboides]|nr:hypothetical protein [Adiantum nelumboides]